MGTFGVSYIGIIFLLLLTIPNLIWTKYQPEGYDSSHENKQLLVLERVGQVACTICLIIFSDYNIKSFTAWSWWFIIACILMIMYEICWIRYFIGKHTLLDFYRSFLGIPVPLASLPVIAFLLLGVYGKVIWMIVSSIIIGIGHIGIHLQHLLEIKKKNK